MFIKREMTWRRDCSLLLLGFLCMFHYSTAQDCPGRVINDTLNIIAGINGSVSFVFDVGRPRFTNYELYKDSTMIGLFYGLFSPFPKMKNINIESSDEKTFNITYRDIKEDDSGHYCLLDVNFECMCWTFYALDMSATLHSYIEAGTTLYTHNLPYLPSDIKTRMNVTTTWYFGGEEVGSDGLIVQPWMNRLNMTYSIKNVRNNTAEFDITLLVAFNKDIQLSTSKLMLVYGETVPDVRCFAACNPSCIYHWEKNNLTLTNTPTLSLGQADLNISGEYVCLAKNSAIQTSVQTVLKVYYHDADVKIVPGDKLFFLTGTNDIESIDCVFHCYPACMIEWYRDGVLLQQSHTLFIEKLPSSRTGLYTCRAYHKEMNGTSIRTLFIYDLNEVTKTTADLKSTLIQTKDDLKLTDHIQTGFMVFQSILIVGLITYLLQQRFGWCSCSYLRKYPPNQPDSKITTDNNNPHNSTVNTSGVYIGLQPRTGENEAYESLETGAIPLGDQQRTDTYENMTP